MPLYLHVPYEEKNKAKLLGAKWDKSRKQWFVQDKNDYRKFRRWYPYLDAGFNEIICDWVYIVRAKYQCPHCNKYTSVIAFAIQNYFEIEINKNGKIKSWGFVKFFV